MKRIFNQCALILAMSQMLLVHPVSVVAQQNDVQTDHAVRIKTLSEQLRWRKGGDLKQYESIKDDVTKKLVGEIDAYITDSFTSDSTVGEVKTGLDTVLGRKDGDDMHNLVFSTNLAGCQFLIVGIELLGGGTNASNGYGNGVSFRAYTISGSKFVYVASTENLSDSALVSLNALRIPAPPVTGEFWFMAWADVPPLAPYTVAMRLYAFDGKSFRTVWAPVNIIADNVNRAVEIGADSRLVINRMPDFKSQTILHEKYSITTDGPEKIAGATSKRE